VSQIIDTERAGVLGMYVSKIALPSVLFYNMVRAA
jgi:hypothetical protein